MPIHDQSYRRYRGRRESHQSAWTVIALAGIGQMIRRRAFIGLMLFAWIPFIVRAVQVYVSVNFPQASMLAATAETYRKFLDDQGVFLFFVTIWVGAGLIANDRRSNALQVYLSKPLSRIDYVAGKMAVLMTFLLLVTWVPAMLLLVFQVMFQGSFTFLRDNLYLVPAITLFSFVQALVASFTMLALSSLSKSGRFVGVLYTGVVLFSDALFQAMRAITGQSRMAWLAFHTNLAQIGDVIFREPPRYETPVAVSLVVVLALIAVSISVLDRRVRGVEVIS